MSLEQAIQNLADAIDRLAARTSVVDGVRPAPENTPAPEVSPARAPAPVKEKKEKKEKPAEVSLDDVRSAFTSAKAIIGNPAPLKQILVDMKVAAVSEIPPERRQEALDAVKALLP